MIVLSIPAPWMVMALILAPRPVFHPFDQSAVPAGSWTVSPSLAASIASHTASGVKSVAVRVSAAANPSEQRREARAQARRRTRDGEVTPWELNTLSSFPAEVVEEGIPAAIGDG